MAVEYREAQRHSNDDDTSGQVPEVQMQWHNSPGSQVQVGSGHSHAITRQEPCTLPGGTGMSGGHFVTYVNV